MSDAGQGQLPLCTVVICNFNYGKYIAEAIESVCEQDYPNKRIVVVDDCSTDDSYELLQKMMEDYKTVVTNDLAGMIIIGKVNNTGMMLLHNHENKGPSHSRNKAIKSNWSDSHLFAILDADDKWVQGKLSK